MPTFKCFDAVSKTAVISFFSLSAFQKEYYYQDVQVELLKLFYSILLYSILDCVLLLQEVAFRQSPVCCYPCLYCSLLPHYVISPTMVWSSNWSYTLYLPLGASDGPYIVFNLGDVSSPFLFHIGFVLDYVCHSGSLPNDDVADSVL